MYNRKATFEGRWTDPYAMPWMDMCEMQTRHPAMYGNAPMLRQPYPDIYYKLQPYVLRACDRVEDESMPQAETVEEMAREIEQDVMRTYPELTDDAQRADDEDRRRPEEGPGNAIAVQSMQAQFIYPARLYGPARAGLLRDLIHILLLQELRRRRRRRYW